MLFNCMFLEIKNGGYYYEVQIILYFMSALLFLLCGCSDNKEVLRSDSVTSCATDCFGLNIFIR